MPGAWGLLSFGVLSAAPPHDAVLCCGSDGVCFNTSTLQECADALEPSQDEPAVAPGVGNGAVTEQQPVDPIDVLVSPRVDPAARLLIVESCGIPARPPGFSFDVMDCVVVDLVEQCGPLIDQEPYTVHWPISSSWENRDMFSDASLGLAYWAYVDRFGWVRRAVTSHEENGCFR